MKSITTNPASVLGQIKAHRAELLADRTVDLVIPGTGGNLYGRFSAISYEDQRSFGKRWEKLPEATAELRIVEDIVINSLQEFRVKSENGTDPIDANNRIGIMELAPHFDIDVTDEAHENGKKTLRQVLQEIIPDDMHMAALGNAYMEWRGGDSATDDEVFSSASDSTSSD